MKRVTRWLGLAVAVLGMLATGAGVSRAGPIVYNIADYPGYQNGYTVSGTITTDGTLGLLSQGNITAWSVTLSNGATTETFSDGGHPINEYGQVIGVIASATQLSLPDPSPYPGQALGLSLHAPSTPGNSITWARYSFVPNNLYDALHNAASYDWRVTGSNLDAFPWVIATAGVSSVPEPASLASGGLAALILLGYGRRRRARAAARRR